MNNLKMGFKKCSIYIYWNIFQLKKESEFWHVTALMNLKDIIFGDFPGGPVVKNLPSNAGDTGSISGQGTKIPHAAGQ